MQRFSWTKECDDSFKTLKSLLTKNLGDTVVVKQEKLSLHPPGPRPFKSLRLMELRCFWNEMVSPRWDQRTSVNIPKGGSLIIEPVARETMNNFDDSTILAGDRIMEMDDDDDDLCKTSC